ncbi:DUF4861 family protein [Gramella sp. AN32]|uniref:DUF4861 family protein n=1 Tax=Christiangramia antarctica TaxID=2058158 RepID=A0ABW5X4U8_9FLAO|nr:DUF4861 family protein [Gramella sp. AN32]MCM4156929.1 DUF4861 domain-containing protein [Gramella sp. AN32]
MKDKYIYLFFLAISTLNFISCDNPEEKRQLTIEIENDLDFSRKEVVSIPYEKFENLLEEKTFNSLRIKRDSAESYLRTQSIDYDEDGIPEELLFQAEVAANSKSRYIIVLDSTIKEPESDVIAFSRFVPERTDDYTWENDKVAFRTYGPTGQEEALAGVPGSTLSSGIDLWLKRTDKTIIDKWYAEHGKNPGYYHIDHGEGYDPYHVGGSRGTGGSGIWENDSLYVSQNFTDYKTIADGPLRTVFELEYAPWGPYNIKETKKITLDLGSNFSKFEVSLESDEEIQGYSVGITLHDNKGEYAINEEEGWIRHWEEIDSSFVGEGLVLNPTIIDSAFARKAEIPDQSNLLVITNPENKITYYAGFAWDKSGQVSNLNDWDAMLKKQALIMKNPLRVEVEN